MSKFLSLEWFKSKIERSVENVISKKIDNLIEKMDGEEDNIPSLPEYDRPYKTMTLTNDVLTVVLHDGAVLSKSNSTINDFFTIKKCQTEEEVVEKMMGTEEILSREEKEKEKRRLEALSKGVELLLETGEFELSVDGKSIYMKGIKRTIPQLLIERFAEIVYNANSYVDGIEYQSLKKFWMKCCLNPNAQSAEDLYEFLANHQFKIDKHGNFYAYRRVVSKRSSQNKELVNFVSNTYTKVKSIWKKSPKDYGVFYNTANSEYIFKPLEDGPTLLENFTGNLEELYLELPSMQKSMFTSAHTGMEDYRVGEVISMPRYEGDDDNSVNCSKGFHAASKAYDYSYFGDTPILVIINPMDVLAVPLGEVGKLRTCRWFFAAVLDESEKHILDDDDFDVTDLGDIFEEKCLENMTEYVQNRFSEEVKRHTFTLPTISDREVSKIVHSLEYMKAILSGRVIQEEQEDEYYNYDDDCDCNDY